MADGTPGRPVKYVDGYDRVNLHVSHLLKMRLREFCSRFRLTQTEALEIAIHYCTMPQAERETKLRELAFELEAVKKELQGKDEELARLRAQLRALQQRASYTVRSAKADEILKSTREMLAQGRLSPKSLAFRCDEMLRPFLKEKIPDEQKQEIVAFISQATGHQGGSA